MISFKQPRLCDNVFQYIHGLPCKSPIKAEMGRILPVFYFYGLFGPFVTPFFTATPIKQTGHQLTVESKGNKSTKHRRSDLSHRQKASVHIKISMWQYFLNGIPHPGQLARTKYSSVCLQKIFQQCLQQCAFAKAFSTVCLQ